MTFQTGRLSGGARKGDVTSNHTVLAEKGRVCFLYTRRSWKIRNWWFIRTSIIVCASRLFMSREARRRRYGSLTNMAVTDEWFGESLISDARYVPPSCM